jgi:hypothetical protein
MTFQDWDGHLLQTALIQQNLPFIERSKFHCQLPESRLTTGLHQQPNQKGLANVGHSHPIADEIEKIIEIRDRRVRNVLRPHPRLTFVNLL